MSSITTTPTPVTPPTLSSLFSKLTIDELTQVVTAATPALTTVATGDGSTTSLMGAWLSLQGAFIGNASVFQKVGVNDLGAAILSAMNMALADAQAKAVASTTASATGSTGGAA